MRSDAKEEDNHQVKHWVLDHPELSSPPKFKFTIFFSFQDPLTRQIAESVRIERGSGSISNSKSEYFRSHVPRLRIDMEGCKHPAMELRVTVEVYTAEEARVVEEDGLDNIESSSRRMEAKRKGEEAKGRKAK